MINKTKTLFNAREEDVFIFIIRIIIENLFFTVRSEKLNSKTVNYTPGTHFNNALEENSSKILFEYIIENKLNFLH